MPFAVQQSSDNRTIWGFKSFVSASKHVSCSSTVTDGTKHTLSPKKTNWCFFEIFLFPVFYLDLFTSTQSPCRPRSNRWPPRNARYRLWRFSLFVPTTNCENAVSHFTTFRLIIVSFFLLHTHTHTHTHTQAHTHTWHTTLFVLRRTRPRWIARSRSPICSANCLPHRRRSRERARRRPRRPKSTRR